MKLSKKQKQELALRLFAVVFGFLAITYAVTLLNEIKREQIKQEQTDTGILKKNLYINTGQ